MTIDPRSLIWARSFVEGRDARVDVVPPDAKLVLVHHQKAPSRVRYDQLFDHGVVPDVGGDVARLQVDAQAAQKDLVEPHGLKARKGHGPNEAVELRVNAASGAQNGEGGVGRERAKDLHHVGDHEDLLGPLGKELGKGEVGGRDVQKDGVPGGDLLEGLLRNDALLGNVAAHALADVSAR